MENRVFAHRPAAGYKVTAGQVGKKEVDFVCEKAGQHLNIQVAYLMTEDRVKNREFGNLLKIPSSFPKMVITMDKLTDGNYRGLDHTNIENFLLSIQ